MFLSTHTRAVDAYRFATLDTSIFDLLEEIWEISLAESLPGGTGQKARENTRNEIAKIRRVRARQRAYMWLRPDFRS